MEKRAFNIKLGFSDLYYFMMHHYYTHFSGIFGIIISVAAALVLCFRFSAFDLTEKMVFLIVALCFTVINPVWMAFKAFTQIKTSKTLGGELTYVLDDTCFAIELDGDHVEIPWKEVTRVKDNGRQVVVYISAARGYIWPKKQIKADQDAILEILGAYVPEKKLHLKKHNRG